MGRFDTPQKVFNPSHLTLKVGQLLALWSLILILCSLFFALFFYFIFYTQFLLLFVWLLLCGPWFQFILAGVITRAVKIAHYMFKVYIPGN